MAALAQPCQVDFAADASKACGHRLTTGAFLLPIPARNGIVSKPCVQIHQRFCTFTESVAARKGSHLHDPFLFWRRRSEFAENLVVVTSPQVAKRVVRHVFAQEDDMPIGEKELCPARMSA